MYKVYRINLSYSPAIRSVLLCIFVLLLPSLLISSPGNYNIQVYQTRQGLPTNLTKGIIKDHHGFVWVATDMGLLRFDGKEFRHITTALAEQYPKQFLVTSTGSLLLAHDGGISEIEQNLETGEIFIREFLPGSSSIGPQNLMYPKSLFEDSKGNLWIGEVFSVVRYDGNIIQRYTFSDQFRTGSFIRSFEFAEDSSGNIFASSQQGYVFWLDPETDTFVQISNASGSGTGTINTMIHDPNSNTVFFGAANGLYHIQTNSVTGEPPFSFSLFLPLPGVSTIAINSRGDIYAGGWNNWETGLTVITRENGAWISSKIPNFTLNTINRLFIDSNDMIWAATDDGISLVYRTPFFRLPIQQERNFVQALSKHPTANRFFMTDAHFVYDIIPATDGAAMSYNIIFENQVFDDLLTVAASSSAVWVGSSLGRLYRLPLDGDKKEPELVMAAENENSIFFSMVDKDDNVWFVQYNEMGVSKRTKDGRISNYRSSRGISQNINVIRQGAGGHIYAASGGHHKLYRFNDSRNVFEAIPNNTQSIASHWLDEIRVNDISIDINGNVYIASNQGVYFYDHNTGLFDELEIGSQIDGKYIKAIAIAIAIEDNNDLWLGTENGVFYHDLNLNLTIEFDEEKGGIPSRTIAYRGVLLTENQQLWIATPAGVGVFDGKEDFRETNPPLLIEARINDEITDLRPPFNFSNTSILSLYFVSLSHPGSGVSYQYRFSEDENWIDLGRRSDINIAGLRRGSHNVHIRALQTSGHIWSNELLVPFYVRPPWYFQTASIIGFIILLLFLTAGFTSLYTQRLRKAKITLENLVEARVEELKRKNDELEVARNQLSESESRYRSFYELSPVGITMHRLRDGVYTNCNEQFLLMTGYDLDELKNMSVRDITPGKYHESGNQQLDVLERTNRFGPYEKELIHKSGHLIPVLVNGIKLTDANGDSIVYSVIQDITERKKFEHQLLQLNDDKDRLVATIAHDIRNPISAIYSYSDLLRNDADINVKEQKVMFEGIFKNSETALTIASNLLELATLEAEAGKLTKKRFDASSLIEKIKSKYSVEAEKKQISFKITQKHTKPIYGIQNTLERVFDNLITNALKFTPKGGHVEVMLLEHDSFSEIIVQDNGIGIPFELQSKIFDRFTAAKRQGLAGEQSTGLGISIVKEIIEQHQGKISVESEPHKGTTFRIRIPL